MRVIITLFILGHLSNCQNDSSQSNGNNPSKEIIGNNESTDEKYDEINTLRGDFNGDQIEEKVTLGEKKIADSDFGSFKCNIWFTDKTIPSLPIGDCPQCFLVEEGDINGDGTDDFSIFQTERHGSRIASFVTYAFINGSWQIIHEILLHLDDENAPSTLDLVEPGSAPNRILAFESELTDGNSYEESTFNYTRKIITLK